MQDLLLQRVIIPVTDAERFQGFYSNLFTVPKKEGTVCPIQDLKALNCFVRVRKFRMESIRSVVVSLHLGFSYRHRHQRCLPAHPDLRTTSAFPPLCCVRGALSICGVTLLSSLRASAWRRGDCYPNPEGVWLSPKPPKMGIAASPYGIW